ncbi:MAG: DUF2283 domain-containing protein [Nanoarchaeota archaeon]|nr:DUF2283 domain-containing protein [Nanoarchaeota archaeon]
MTDFNFRYDKEYDILYILKKGEIVKHSIDWECSFIVDFNSKDKVVGMEILDVSKNIFGLNKKIIMNLENCDIKTQQKGDMLLVLITLKSKNMEPIRTSLPIPIKISC